MFKSLSGAVTLLCCLASVAHAHPVLKFVEQTTSQAGKDPKQQPASAEFPVSVTLGHKYLTVDAQGIRQIYDFERRRLFELNLANRTYADVSLFSVLGFNSLELQNRMRIDALLNSAQVRESQSPALMEHLFSLTADPETVIDSAHSKDATIYSFKGKELLSVSSGTKPLPADYQPEYWRWLRYAVGGHPKIYAQMQKRAGVPERVRIVRPSIVEQVVTLRLTSVTNGADAPYSLEGFTRAEPKREPYVSLQKIGREGPATFATRVETAKHDRDVAAAESRSLDAALAHFVYALSTGDSSTTWLVQTREQMAADPDARAFAASLSAKNAEQADQALKTLGALRAKSTSPYAYLLDVFAANHEVSLKHSTNAEKLFLAALAQNPYLTGAWFDLGKLYYGNLKTRDAWACWDTARLINPGHPFGKNIETMERQMVADHPELF